MKSCNLAVVWVEYNTRAKWWKSHKLFLEQPDVSIYYNTNLDFFHFLGGKNYLFTSFLNDILIGKKVQSSYWKLHYINISIYVYILWIFKSFVVIKAKLRFLN